MSKLVWLKKKDDPQVLLASVLNNDTKLESMKKHSTKLAKPNSTQVICDTIF